MSSREVAEAARVLFDGVSPDDDPWRGGPIKIKLSFVSPEPSVREKENPDGTTTFSGTLKFYGVYRDGVLADSLLINRFMKAYPGEEKTLIREFLKRVKAQESALKKKIDRVSKYEGRFKQWAAPWTEEEWEEPTQASWRNFRVDKNRAEVRKWKISMPWLIDIVVTMRRKQAVTDKPFSAMSDQELDRYLEAWAQDAPENYHMDGEWQGSPRALGRYWREAFRSYSPRRQVDLYERLKRRHRLATRIAKRWLVS